MVDELNANLAGYVSRHKKTPVERKDISRAQREKKKREDAAKDAKIVELKNTVTKLKEILDEREEMISEIQRSIGERDRAIGERDRAIGDRERRYAELLFRVMRTQRKSGRCSPIVRRHMPTSTLGGQPPYMRLDEDTNLSQESDVD